MSHELLYTSAPAGLERGSRGFCTVCSSAGIPHPLVTILESLSGYRHLYPPGDANAVNNPVVWSHLKLQAAGKHYHVVSRVSDYGLDYSQRSNKLAHHLALDGQHLPAGGPAWALGQPELMLTEWDGTPKTLPKGRIPAAGDSPHRVCSQWAEATGDAGWAGVLAESFLANPERHVYLVFQPGVQLLPLLAEAIALLPVEQRWDVTFSTYHTNLPPGIICNWRCVLAESAEAHQSRRFVQALRIELSVPLPKASGGALVAAARTGVDLHSHPSISATSISEENAFIREPTPGPQISAKIEVAGLGTANAKHSDRDPEPDASAAAETAYQLRPRTAPPPRLAAARPPAIQGQSEHDLASRNSKQRLWRQALVFFAVLASATGLAYLGRQQGWFGSDKTMAETVVPMEKDKKVEQKKSQGVRSEARTSPPKREDNIPTGKLPEKNSARKLPPSGTNASTVKSPGSLSNKKGDQSPSPAKVDTGKAQSLQIVGQPPKPSPETTVNPIKIQYVSIPRSTDPSGDRSLQIPSVVASDLSNVSLFVPQRKTKIEYRCDRSNSNVKVNVMKPGLSDPEPKHLMDLHLSDEHSFFIQPASLFETEDGNAFRWCAIELPTQSHSLLVLHSTDPDVPLPVKSTAAGIWTFPVMASFPELESLKVEFTVSTGGRNYRYIKPIGEGEDSLRQGGGDWKAYTDVYARSKVPKALELWMVGESPAEIRCLVSLDKKGTLQIKTDQSLSAFKKVLSKGTNSCLKKLKENQVKDALLEGRGDKPKNGKPVDVNELLAVDHHSAFLSPERSSALLQLINDAITHIQKPPAAGQQPAPPPGLIGLQECRSFLQFNLELASFVKEAESELSTAKLTQLRISYFVYPHVGIGDGVLVDLVDWKSK